MKQLFTAIACLFFFLFAKSQDDPEFPKGWVMYLEEQHGVATNFTVAPDLFVSGLRLSPQVTVVPGLLRLGATAGCVFNNKKADGTFGPNLAVKLATIGAGSMGSVLNVQLQAEHLWGTRQQKLLGGLLHIELGQLLVFGLSAHREYNFNYWWFQTGIGYNLAHTKKQKGVYSPFKKKNN